MFTCEVDDLQRRPWGEPGKEEHEDARDCLLYTSGAGPGAYDCSGLTMAAWASVGVTLAHASSVQQTEGVAVTAAQLVPGDLVLVPGSDSPGPGLAGHVGIYLGDDLVVSAIDTEYGLSLIHI